ncbi:cation:proton antiporter domain-containing protein [Agarivorans litoreus]|uniref:cation:proton antiporter domain-containing protein n=1 Tax=Agarivorans litoreus TaxID=1510455 RepID=UPI001C7CCE3C|nr:cation:proton antiporter [Agarivorans litoreus]
MDVSSVLFVIIFILGVSAVSVLFFQRIGFGSVLGFIVAGVVLGPYTPGPVAIEKVENLQAIAEVGVLLFLFIVGLEMRPKKIWSMRKLMFGLGSAQILGTAAVFVPYFIYFHNLSLQSAIVLGLGFALSSTAIVMSTLEEKGALPAEHGQASFAILMSQDLWIIPIMALIPLLTPLSGEAVSTPWWYHGLLILSVLSGIAIIGHVLLPLLLGYCAKHRRMEAFSIILFFTVITAGWAVDQVGVSMTLGAFFLGVLLSASDYRYQVEATVAPFKSALMGLFFISVGMTINVGAFIDDWSMLLIQVPVVLLINTTVLIVLASLFGVKKGAAVRTGFYLSQVGEFTFVLLGVAIVSGLLNDYQHTLAMLVVSISMICTPFMMKIGDWIATQIKPDAGLSLLPAKSSTLERHVVIVGYNEMSALICMMLEQANVPFVALDRDVNLVWKGKKAGLDIHYGDMRSATTQKDSGISKAVAAYITPTDTDAGKQLAISLRTLYPHLKIYVRVRTLAEQRELVAKGITHAGTSYIESTLLRGSQLLKDIGMSEDSVVELVDGFKRDNYALVSKAFSELEASKK